MNKQQFLEQLNGREFSFLKTLIRTEEEIEMNVNKAIEDSTTADEVFTRLLNDEFIKETNYQFWSTVSKLSNDHWYRVRELLGDDIIKTTSDIGSIALCDDNMTFCSYIPNGMGDGTTRVKVFENNSIEWKIQDMMKYHGIIEGQFNLLTYDCAFQRHNKDDIVYHFDGKYSVYTYEGIIVFVKW